MELIHCLLLGKCKVKEYDYYFYINNEKVKADECHSNLYGASYCYYNGRTYSNVSYESIFVNERIENRDNSITIILTIIICIVFVWIIFNTLLKQFYYI